MSLSFGGTFGHAESHNSIAYWHSVERERDEKKANYYCELAAMLGVVQVRQTLGSEDGMGGTSIMVGP